MELANVCNVTQKELCGSVACKVCFKRSLASHPKVACIVTLRGPEHLLKVMRDTKEEYTFICDLCCEHCTEARPKDIGKDHICKVCEGLELCGGCDSCLAESFYVKGGKYMSMWITKKNGDPELAKQIFADSKEKLWFECGDCGHKIERSPFDIIQVGQFCLYCLGRDNCGKCIVCVEKTFAAHPNAKYWSESNEKKASQVMRSKKGTFLFSCKECDHRNFKATLRSMLMRNPCMYCRGKKLCINEGCYKCQDHSFVSHEKADYWAQSDIKARDVLLYDKKEYKFICDNDHKFMMSPYNIVVNGKWCVKCEDKEKTKNKSFIKKVAGLIGYK
jgi:hypothetical protein